MGEAIGCHVLSANAVDPGRRTRLGASQARSRGPRQRAQTLVMPLRTGTTDEVVSRHSMPCDASRCGRCCRSREHALDRRGIPSPRRHPQPPQCGRAVLGVVRAYFEVTNPVYASERASREPFDPGRLGETAVNASAWFLKAFVAATARNRSPHRKRDRHAALQTQAVQKSGNQTTG